jgi:hypothetical protein
MNPRVSSARTSWSMPSLWRTSLAWPPPRGRR